MLFKYISERFQILKGNIYQTLKLFLQAFLATVAKMCKYKIASKIMLKRKPKHE